MREPVGRNSFRPSDRHASALAENTLKPTCPVPREPSDPGRAFSNDEDAPTVGLKSDLQILFFNRQSAIVNYLGSSSIRATEYSVSPRSQMRERIPRSAD